MQAMEKCGCKKTDVYELLRTGIVGKPAQVFARYHEKNITRIRFHVYGEKGKLTKGIIGYDANALYPFSAGNVMPCGKGSLVVNKKPFDQKGTFSRDIFMGSFKRKSFWVCAG